MTSHYDKDTGRWEVTSGFITVRGPTRDGCEQRVQDLLARMKEIQAERENG